MRQQISLRGWALFVLALLSVALGAGGTIVLAGDSLINDERTLNYVEAHSLSLEQGDRVRIRLEVLEPAGEVDVSLLSRNDTDLIATAHYTQDHVRILEATILIETQRDFWYLTLHRHPSCLGCPEDLAPLEYSLRVEKVEPEAAVLGLSALLTSIGMGSVGAIVAAVKTGRTVALEARDQLGVGG